MSTNVPAKTADEREMRFTPFGASTEIRLTIPIVRNLVATKTKSGQLPSDNQIMKFMMLCQARRLNPFEGDAFLIGFDNKQGEEPTFQLITAHQAFLKRAEVHPEYDGMESGVIVQLGADEHIERDGRIVLLPKGSIYERQGDFFLPIDRLMGGWATVFFKNRKHPITRKSRLATFNKPFGRWKDDPAGMICKCAEADALRSSFPTLLGSMYTEEEMPAEPKQRLIEYAKPTTKASHSLPPEEISDTELYDLNQLIAEHNANGAWIRDTFKITQGRRLLKRDFLVACRRIMSKEFSFEPEPPTEPESPQYSDGEIPNDEEPDSASEIRGYTENEVLMAISNAGKAARTVLTPYRVQRVDELTYEQRRQIVQEMNEIAAAKAEQ